MAKSWPKCIIDLPPGRIHGRNQSNTALLHAIGYSVRVVRNSAAQLGDPAGSGVIFSAASWLQDSGHYSIDSTTVRAHVSVAGGKREIVEEIWAARGSGSLVSFTVLLMPDGDRSPSI
ncbi:hypothetical protein [Novosphingopyxis sp.]|uniref:hypothetical protein n=1 Tax=Novosphingopyxis sp. TaxID=2709690 RepID=UPI003B5C399D